MLNLGKHLSSKLLYQRTIDCLACDRLLEFLDIAGRHVANHSKSVP